MLEARPPSVAGESSSAPATVPPPPDPLAAEVAKAVRELRLAAGLSERAAARLLGTSQTQLRRMEDQRYMPSLRSLARVAAAYGHTLRIEFESKDKAATRARREEKETEEPRAATVRKPARPKAVRKPQRGRAKKRTARPARRGR